MRDLEVRAKWRSAAKFNRLHRVASFEFDNAGTLGTGSLTISPFLTIITGGNGTGKTTLLQALAVACLDDGAIPMAWRRKLSGARLEVKIERASTRYSYVTEIDAAGTIARGGAFASEPFPLAIVALELDEQIRWVQAWAASPGRLREQLEPYTPIELPADDVAMMGRIARKSYRSITLFEIDDVGDSPFPYFLCEEDWPGAVPYGSQSMGLGELRIHTIWWAINRAARESLVIVDEPDASLAESSQAAVADFLAVSAASSGHTFVLSSHASRTIALAPNESLRVLTRDGGRLSILDPATPAQAAAVLGVQRRAGALFLCEDEVARDLLQELVDASPLDISADVELLVAGSESNIRRYLNEFPAPIKAVGIVGAYDGGIEAKAGSRWPAIALPGQLAPEKWVESIISSDVVGFAERLGRAVPTIKVALSSAVGTDLHDWIYEFAKIARATRSEVIRVAVLLWISANAQEYDRFCDNLVKVLRGHPL